MREPDRTPIRALCGAFTLMLTSLCACATVNGPSAPHTLRDSITPLGPRCAGVQSCLLGQVIAAESAAPLPGAAIFLERMGQEEGVKIQALTDDQGIFTIFEPPPGHYRMAVYKEARSHEISGVRLGEQGTTVVPIRLAPPPT
jgi:hypothetical protein